MAITCSYRFAKRRGFSLLEISLVLAIIAVVVGGALAMFSASMQTRQYQETQAKTKAIQQALYNFRLVNNRIPCPADITIAPTATNFGIEAANPGLCTDGAPQANFSGGAASNNTATFVKTDTTTQGNWVGTYGADGYYIVGDNHSYPSYLTSLTFSGNTYYYWGTCALAKCLTKASNHAQQVEAMYGAYSGGMVIGVNTSVTGGAAKQVTLYSVDDPPWGIKEYIFVTDASSGALLDQRAIDSATLAGGVYLVWTVSGNVVFTMPPGVISGVFFDPSITAAPSAAGSFMEGMVPTKALGLPDDYAFDGWGRRIIYAVSTPMTEPNAFNYITVSDTTMRLTVNDATGAHKTQQAAYVLASLGAYGHGAYPHNGGTSRINFGTTNLDHLNNCDCSGGTGAITATGLDGIFVQKVATIDPTKPTHVNDFDDIVAYGTRATLRSPTE